MNWLELIVAALLPQVVGFLWYHPKVLGNVWQKATGINDADRSKANMPLIIGVTTFLAFMVAIGLNFVIHSHDMAEQTFAHGAFHGVMSGVFFMVPVIVTSALYEFRKFSYMAVTAGYWLVSLALMGGLIGAWH